MHTFFKTVVLFIFLFSSGDIISQEKYDFSNLNSYEEQLIELFDTVFANDSIKFYQSDSLKIRLNKEILNIFDEALTDENSFYYPFENIKQIGVKLSDNGLVKIITWNLKFSNGSYSYFGYIQHKNDAKSECMTYKLVDKSEEPADLLNMEFCDTNWYGALYYKIITNIGSEDTLYTLLGWDGYNYLSTKKIIDILYFDEEGNPRFGKQIFKVAKQESSRLIFEYSEKASMSLVYDEKLNMIVYDYLMPPIAAYKNQYQYYGPDGSYDALCFSDGKWIHYPNIDIKKLRNTGYKAGKPRKGDYSPKRIYD
jgi:hypothetical protein